MKEAQLEQRHEEAGSAGRRASGRETSLEALKRSVAELRAEPRSGTAGGGEVIGRAGRPRRAQPRRGAAFARIDRMHRELEARVCADHPAVGRQLSRTGTTRSGKRKLVATREQLIEARDTAQREAACSARANSEVAGDLAAMERNLKTLRDRLDPLREDRGSAAQAAKLAVGAARHRREVHCGSEPGGCSIARRGEMARSTVRLAAKKRRAGDSAAAREMGPVNMMALEEYNETAQRHSSLKRSART